MSAGLHQSTIDSTAIEADFVTSAPEEATIQPANFEPKTNAEPQAVLEEIAVTTPQGNGAANPEEQKEEVNTDSSVEVVDKAAEFKPVPTAIYTSAATEQPVITSTITPDQQNVIQGTAIATGTAGESAQVYAKLEGENLCYYICNLEVSLGRKASNNDQVDVHLGNTKSISRQHARLFYNFLNQRFELDVLGKNGVFVNDVYVEKGGTVGLAHKSKIQICDTSFYFLLPKMDSRTEENHTIQAALVPEDSHIASMMSTAPPTGSLAVPLPMEHDVLSVAPSAITADQINAVTSAQSSPSAEIYPKEQKPPLSYAMLIAKAIDSTPAKKMTLNSIYNYISAHYPYYSMSQNGWQNSIRHNLSLNKAFVKVPRGEHEPGKGAFWTIDPNHESQFTGGEHKKGRRSTPRSTASRRASTPATAATPTPAPYGPDSHVHHSVDTE